MLPDQIRIELGGESYVWELDETVSNPDRSWRWSRVRDHIEPSFQLRAQLNQLLIEAHSFRLVDAAVESERNFLYSVFRSMGASNEQMWDIGFQEEIIEDDFDVGAKMFFASVPPASHTFLNSVILRDHFFDHRPPVSFPFELLLIGEDPFTKADLESFFEHHNISISEMLLPTTVIVMGREGWDKGQVNSLIEASAGRSLRVYSQELLLSILAGLPDPFEQPMPERRAHLPAYRSGHPGLEFVSKGWLGWVMAVVPLSGPQCSFNPGTRGRLQEGKYEDRAEESPLHAMGYHVGKSGLTQDDRQKLLGNCFSGIIPWVQNAAYMEEWGNPGSPERLRRIALQLTTNLENTRNRSDWQRYGDAIEDWQEDLLWLKASFYRGNLRFSWPSALVDGS